MYQKVPTDLNFVEREKEVEKFWRENDIFKKSMDNRKKGETYTFYDGPPTANGKPHIGHVLTRVIKDMIPRYRTMKGYMVPRKAGWDTHGLPVELEVEKLLGLDGKEQIEEYGLAPFTLELETVRSPGDRRVAGTVLHEQRFLMLLHNIPLSRTTKYSWCGSLPGKSWCIQDNPSNSFGHGPSSRLGPCRATAHRGSSRVPPPWGRTPLRCSASADALQFGGDDQ